MVVFRAFPAWQFRKIIQSQAESLGNNMGHFIGGVSQHESLPSRGDADRTPVTGSRVVFSHVSRGRQIKAEHTYRLVWLGGRVSLREQPEALFRVLSIDLDAISGLQTQSNTDRATRQSRRDVTSFCQEYFCNIYPVYQRKTVGGSQTLGYTVCLSGLSRYHV